MRDLLESVGPTLETLKVRRFIEGRFLLDVQLYCRSLLGFQVHELQNGTQQDELTVFLISYGTQLQYVRAPNLRLSQYRSIVLHCPDADFWVRSPLAFAADVMLGLSDRLIRMSVNGCDPPDAEALRHSALHCTRLARIRWGCTFPMTDNIASMRVILPPLERSLDTLDIHDRVRGSFHGCTEIPADNLSN